MFHQSDDCTGDSVEIMHPDPDTIYNGEYIAKMQNSVDSIMINRPLCWVMLAQDGEGFHQQYLANQTDQCFNLHGTMRNAKSNTEGYNVWINNETYEVPCNPPSDTPYTTTDPPCAWRATGNCSWKGPREPWRDEDDCNIPIPLCKGSSGWCDCNGDDVRQSWEPAMDCIYQYNATSNKIFGPDNTFGRSSAITFQYIQPECNYTAEEQSFCFNASCNTWCGHIKTPTITVTNTTTSTTTTTQTMTTTSTTTTTTSSTTTTTTST